jgi:hypothetical protein
MRFIMPRELSFTLPGAWPSAQLIALSAVALLDAVVDQSQIDDISNYPVLESGNERGKSVRLIW